MMKKLVLWLSCFTLLLLACSKNSGNANSTTGNNNPPPPPTGSADTVLVQGNFSAAAHATSGTAQIYSDNGSWQLKLKNFKTENGPDLKVYLSVDKSASDFINLGDLKTVNGDQQYTIPGTPDFSKYTYTLIWCQQYAVLFGAAELQ